MNASADDMPLPATLWSSKGPVVPKSVKGSMRRLKWIVLTVLLAIYWTVPWLRWDRGPHAPDQAFLIDMPHRKAYFLFFEIWPQEVYIVTGVLLMMAVGLFLITSLLGRVWCGYACPQTVWTDLFMAVERWIEGDRAQRLRLKAAPLGFGKAGKYVAKHLVWLVIAAFTGGAWVMYFNDAPTIMPQIFTGQAGSGVYLTIGLLTASTYFMAGWARETVCTFACPYARFQSAMFDRDTFMVSYRGWRGEPRGKRKANAPKPAGQGDCIDCFQCVEVCPTGVDIRKGAQVDCISCGLCIDACNTIMARIGSPSGLIAYDTERNLSACAQGQTAPRRFVRPRTVFYALVYVLAGCIILYLLLTRSLLDANVEHDRNPMFVMLSDGAIRNAYTLKLMNKTVEPQIVTLDIRGLAEGAKLSLVGADEAGGTTLTLKPDAVTTLRAYVSVPQAAWAAEIQNFTFHINAANDALDTGLPARFEGP